MVIDFLSTVKRLALGFMLVMVWAHTAQAQKPEWEKEGGIPNAEIEIVKDKKINLPPADRNFQKIAPRPVEPVRHDIVYEYRNIRFNTADFSPVIRPLKLKQEDIAKIYGNYISGGFGNYASPYVEAYLNSRRDKNRFYGLHFFHHSFGTGPVDGKNSASSNSEVKLFGKSITDDVTLSGDLNFRNRNGYFYGYAAGPEPSRGSIQQSYNTYAANVALENSKPGDLSYRINGGVSYLTDQYHADEAEVSLGAKGDYRVSDQSKIRLAVEYFFISRKDSATKYDGRNLLKVKPAYQFRPLEGLTVSVGLNFAAENDLGAKMHVYPNVYAEYALAESVSAYAALTGDIDKVTLHSLAQDNFWLGSNLAVIHTNRQAELLGGLKGKLTGKISFVTGVSSSNLQNLYSFRNTAADQAKFEITYNKTTRFNLFGELGFNPGENIKMTVRGDAYRYTTEAVYHRPRYRVAYTSSFNLFDKVWIGADLIAQGGMKAYNFADASTVTLPAAFDLNAKADYFFSRRVSAFLKFNNILSNQYQMFLNYPVRGFQVMGGVTCTF